MPFTPPDTSQIVITASREPETEAKTPASVIVIDQARIERLGEPLVPALLRLSPSAAVSISGPAGSFTEVRIRGAEVNHTLLFIDGIRANDPATGDFPRFDLLNSDMVSRIEIVRGPQSALWGSEAIGGVIAVNGTPSSSGRLGAAVEAGSFGFARGSASAAAVGDGSSLAAAVGWQRSNGIDSFGGGDKDGYRNLSGRFRSSFRIGRDFEAGAAGFALTGRSEFDGYDPVTFLHADTLDNSRNHLLAGRLWLQAGGDASPWSGHIGSALLGSSNRNFLDQDPVNRTTGRRWSLDGQAEHRFAIGAIDQRLILAADAEWEEFRARDVIYSGFSNQDRDRTHHALTGEWRADAGRVNLDVALRHDMFNRFKDATTFRASGQAELGGDLSLAGSYAEGIAQPTFFDLYGFFPSIFTGNPDLKPERSRGFEGSLRYRHGPLNVSLTGYRQRLHGEIVDATDPITHLSTTVNRRSQSRREGIEAELGWIISRVRLSANYAYLNATEPGEAGALRLRETRRPKHSGSVALDGSVGRVDYGVTLAYAGLRHDVNFDVFPSERVDLSAYWLLGARIAYAVTPNVQFTVRGSNLLGDHYQEAFGYRTEPRGLFAGLTVRR